MKDLETFKLSFYARRSFTAKLDAVFMFVQENWKVVLKYMALLILPGCLILAYCSNLSMKQTSVSPDAMYDSSFLAMLMLNMCIMMVVALSVSILLIALSYTLFQLYTERPERLSSLTFADLKAGGLFRKCLRGLSMLLFLGLMLIPVGMICAGILAAMGDSGTGYLYLLGVLLLILFLLMPFFAFLTPTYLLEENTFLEAFSRSCQIGMRTWGSTLALLLVLGLISLVASCIIALPWYVALTVQYYYFQSDLAAGLGLPLWYEIMFYAFAVLQLFGSYAVSMLGYIGIMYQYGHACARKQEKEKPEEA